MKKFTMWVSVNDEEYYTKMVFFGNYCTILTPIEIDNEIVYPVDIDGKIIYFDEKVEVE